MSGQAPKRRNWPGLSRAATAEMAVASERRAKERTLTILKDVVPMRDEGGRGEKGVGGGGLDRVMMNKWKCGEWWSLLYEVGHSVSEKCSTLAMCWPAQYKKKGILLACISPRFCIE